MWKRLMRLVDPDRWHDQEQFKEELPDKYGRTDLVTCVTEDEKFYLYKPLEDIFRLTRETPLALKDVTVETDLDILILEFDMKESLKKKMNSDVSFSWQLMYCLLARMFPNCHVEFDDDHSPNIYVTITPISDNLDWHANIKFEADYILNSIKSQVVADITNTIPGHYKSNMILKNHPGVTSMVIVREVSGYYRTREEKKDGK